MRNQLSRDLQALAAAEIDREYILAVREYLNGDGADDPPDPSLYGLSVEEAQPLVLQVLQSVIPAHAAAA